MSNIPEARDRLTVIAADIQDKGDYHTAQAILAIVDDLLWKKQPDIKKPAPMTKARAKAVNMYAKRNPHKTEDEIADHFGLTHKQVIGALMG